MMVPQEPIPEPDELDEAVAMLENADEWIERWKMVGRQKARQEVLYFVARNALRKQMSHEDIAELTGLFLKEVQRIASGLVQ